MPFTSNQQSQYMRSIIEASPDPLIAISPEGKITDLNEANVTVTGVMREKLIGTFFQDYFTDPESARSVYQEIFAKGVIADSPLTFRHRVDGKLTDVLINGSVYKDAEGKVLGVVAVARDITAQKLSVELRIVNKELGIANEELAFQNKEKEKRAAELGIANEELAFQNKEKEKRAAELGIANEELAFQNQEKEKRAAELGIANNELIFQNKEKEKRAAELGIANEELAFQNQEKEKRAAELGIANKELVFQNNEKEKRAAELRIANYALSLIEASRDPLLTINSEGKVTGMNEATVNIIGASRKKLIGSDFSDHFTEPLKARECYEEAFAKGFVVDCPLTVRHTNGKLTDVLFNGSVYKDDSGTILGIVVVARDITEQKRIASELTEAKVFAELATHIAEEAVHAKQQFLSNMSHEIRTPMNAIIGFTKVLLKTDLTAKQKEYLGAIQMSGDALIVLINDILDLAKVDAGKMSFEETPFKLAASISAMLHLFEPKIEEKNLKLVKQYDYTIPEVLLGDPVRLHQIILNLVSNAVKFTAEGKITVSVELVSQDAEKAEVRFSVVDTGIGIAENKLDGIFENFQQASSSTSRIFGGTGLGLAIAKQLVEAQGGLLTVESTVGVGSTFSFSLSLKKTDAKPETEIAEEVKMAVENSGIRVLVVEDIALNQLLMKTLLDDFGFTYDIAGNGKIAIEKLREKQYDVILMDLQMPEMNGFEATHYIRKSMKSGIPIIALTADVTTVDIEKCKAVGMDDYIAKPVDERALYNKIIKVLKASEPLTVNENPGSTNGKEKPERCIDLYYLLQRTKANPVLMMEMIKLYLDQTPALITIMKESLRKQDWTSLHSAVHKIIPSFSIMGISQDFENMAKKIQEYAATQVAFSEIQEMFVKIETVCTQACEELEIEFTLLKEKQVQKS